MQIQFIWGEFHTKTTMVGHYGGVGGEAKFAKRGSTSQFSLSIGPRDLGIEIQGGLGLS
jgi:hypothetical protein